MCISSSSCKLHVKHLILELHLKAKGVRKRQHLSTLFNLEVGVRIVAKPRDNWKLHKIYEKDTIFYTNQNENWPNFTGFSHLKWQSSTWIEEMQLVNDPSFPSEPLPHTVQTMCDTDRLMPCMCLWSWTEPLTWQAGEHLNQADIGPDHNIWVLWVRAEQTILSTLALIVSLKSGKLRRK